MKNLVSIAWLIALTAAFAQEAGWTSSSGDYYRPGYCWPVRLELPATFLGSDMTAIASMGNWEFHLPGQAVRKQRQFIWFVPPQAFPTLKLRMQNHAGNILWQSDYKLTLRPVALQEYLVGSYGVLPWRELPEVTSDRKIRLATMPHLPDRREGLDLFNLLVWGQAECTREEENALIEWVYSGGILAIFRSLENYPALQRLVHQHTLEADSAVTGRPLIFFRIGLGGGLYSKDPHFFSAPAALSQIWPNIIAQLPGTPSQLTRFARLPTPPFAAIGWDRRLLVLLVTVVIGHLVVLLMSIATILTIMRRFRRQDNKKFGLGWAGAVIVGVTVASTTLLTTWLADYQPVSGQTVTVARVGTGSNIVSTTSYHCFVSLRPHLWQWQPPAHIWPLPAAESMLTATATPYHFFYTGQGWSVQKYLDSANCKEIWCSQSYLPLAGGTFNIRQYGTELIMQNESDLSLLHGIYLKRPQIMQVGPLLPGKTLRLQIFPDRLSLATWDNLPHPWNQTPAVFFFLASQSSGPVFISMAELPAAPAWATSLAAYRQVHLVEIPADK